ncbi:NDP-hexose 2,3-dehydratase family protein [Streptomyces sp. NPDC059740]|uniref:NDP-hexose 2,3-dehydratase family protein n=1 Tax=Streptomyces sp. NPDC059740 TaxID=3346926 RepID=UPI00364A13A1
MTLTSTPAPRSRSAGLDRLRAGLALSRSHTAPGQDPRTRDVAGWLESRSRAHHFDVRRIGFDRLRGWAFDPDTGDLRHESGRFFSVGGLAVCVDEGERQWRQPIIHQPDVGILGILVKRFQGVPHLLMQAKMEPGNPNVVQLSPTVQATRSNYSRVHRGSGVRYVEYFTDPARGRVLADVLQSEHGSWFYRKANRNMVVETDEDVAGHPDFLWLTLGQLGRLLREDLVVNMDARSVLACLPVAHPDEDTTAWYDDTELLSWFTGERARRRLTAERIGLAQVPEWIREPASIRHRTRRYFEVVAVEVEAGSREVRGWTQPLFAPRGLGVTAFLTRRIAGVPHLLVHARVEGGFLDTVELGPTVQYTPVNHPDHHGARRPPFLDLVRAAPRAAVRYEAFHSEEGGRFLGAVSRYAFLDADLAGAPWEPPPGYQWVTPGQLGGLARHGHYVNVQARTLLSCLTTGAVRL